MKKIVSFLLVAVMILTAVSAVAETGVAYGVYANEGEHPDSLIRATVVTDGDKITEAAFDEKLIPVSIGGAEGWAVVDEATAALLGDAVVANGNAVVAASVRIGDTDWTIDSALTISNDGKGEFFAYVCTPEGGEWYFAQDKADLLDASGNAVATVEIGTKESIGHGVGFWPSALLFPGNIEALENFVVENGVDYSLDDVTMGENGWKVADAETGATLAGTPNYLRLAQEAFNAAK